MTAPEPEYEYAVQWTSPSGAICFVSDGYTEAGARLAARLQTREHWIAAVVRRPVAAWSPVPPEGKQATK